MYRGFKNILIICPLSADSFVSSLPALTALRRALPAAEINCLARPELARFLEKDPAPTRLIFFDRVFFGKAWYHIGAFIALCSFIWRLRRSRFDIVFDLVGLLYSAELAWFSGCKKRFGMANAREFASVFYTHKVHANSVDLEGRYLEMLESAGISRATFASALFRGNTSEESRSALPEPGTIKAPKKRRRRKFLFFSRIVRPKPKAESWLVNLSFWIPRRHREPMVGDIMADCHDLRELSKGEWRIRIHVLWQLAIGAITLWPEAMASALGRILHPR